MSIGSTTRRKACSGVQPVDERRVLEVPGQCAQEPDVEEDGERHLQPGVEQHQRPGGAQQTEVAQGLVERQGRELEGQHQAQQDEQVGAP
ncbi:hypothetical protein [Streptomyces olindensis]|uniref:hypothetical protein n=1 Tax=Streptomyces olindensis TaxID=358823 RepID=UPI0036481109